MGPAAKRLGIVALIVIGAASLASLPCPAEEQMHREFALAIDVSGSMHSSTKQDVVRKTGMQVVQKLLSEGDVFYLLTFTGTADIVGRWEIETATNAPLAAIAGVQATTDGWTNIEAAKALAIERFIASRAQQNVDVEQYLLMLSDGEQTHGIEPGHPLYSLWQQNRDKLQQLTRFGKSGVSLVLMAFDTPLTDASLNSVSPLTSEPAIDHWMDQLQDELRSTIATLHGDAAAHSEDGLVIIPEAAKVVGGKFVLDANEAGIRHTIILRSNFERGYAVGEITAGLTDINSSARDSLLGTECDLDFSAASGEGSHFELHPRAPDESAEADQGTPGSEQAFDLVIRIPESRYPWSSDEEISGAVWFSCNAKLADMVPAQGNTPVVELSADLPKPTALNFVAHRRLDNAGTLAIAVIAGALLLLGLIALYLLSRPVAVMISDPSTGTPETYRLGWSQHLTIGPVEGPMAYPLHGVDATAVLKRTISGKLHLIAREGTLFADGVAQEAISIGRAGTVGFGSRGAEAAEVLREISIVRGRGGQDRHDDYESEFKWSD